jgi:L-asparaginase
VTKKKKRVLLIYTGGTFGMDVEKGASPGKAGRRLLSTPQLNPAELEGRLKRRVPELAELASCDVEIVLNCDSAHIGPAEWRMLADRIRARWRKYDGVVVLHGTDTMAYTASALSLLLRPCLKPVVLTGAQRPLSALRTDARRNLISAVEIAAHGPRDRVGQVCVFFDDRLFQGNRVRKRSASEFGAFESPQAAPLAVVGTAIRYAGMSDAEPDGLSVGSKAPRRGQGARAAGRKRDDARLVDGFNSGVAMLHVTPGLPARSLREQWLPKLSGLVCVVFASGTAPTHDPEFVALLREARAREIPVVVTTEGASEGGAQDASLGTYEAGRALLEEGAYWAGSMTPECAYVKAAWILAQPGGARRFAALWKRNYADEA